MSLPPISSILRNNVKDKLARGEVVSSITVRLVRTIEIARISHAAGFDTLYVDIEHNGFSFDTTGQICQAAQSVGITPFVRVPSIRPEHVGIALDLGALGIIAPHIHSAEDARKLVKAAKYPPYGERSAAGAVPQLNYINYPVSQAYPALNDAIMVIVMIETLEALEKVDEIAAVEGVDMMLVGTNDMTGEMGIPGQYDDPRVEDMFKRTLAACKKHGKHVGVGGLSSRADLMAKYTQMGCRYVSVGTDIAFLAGACIQKAQMVRDIKL